MLNVGFAATWNAHFDWGFRSPQSALPRGGVVLFNAVLLWAAFVSLPNVSIPSSGLSVTSRRMSQRCYSNISQIYYCFLVVQYRVPTKTNLFDLATIYC